MKVIKITASWCVSCIIMNQLFNKVAPECGFDVISYDYDFDSDKIEKYNVGKILPVFIFLDDNGNEIKRLVGEFDKSKFYEV